MMETLYDAIRAIILITLAAMFLTPASATESINQRGNLVGGAPHVAPDWFKESFLDIQDDVDEAFEQGKHLILFFQLDACPYCDRMLTEAFEDEPLSSYIQANFDVIAINIKGDRDIAFNEEISVTEKQLAEILEVRSTPAILFIGEDNKSILRLNGYRAPERFQKALEYVTTKAYKNRSLADYLESKLAKNVYQLRPNPLFDQVTDLSAVKGPLAVIFEDGSCYDCNQFHNRVLARADVQAELKPFTLVRLDADSDRPMIDVDGTKTTPRAMVQKYQMIYRPGVLAFDDGILIRRNDSLIYPFHFKESMRYIAGGHYKNEDPRSYSLRRREELLAAGIDIDLGL
jgi:thioredoxin-related protein